MEIVEVLKKLPKYTQVILSDSQIAFSGEKEFVSPERLKVLEDSLSGIKSCLQFLEAELQVLRQSN